MSGRAPLVSVVTVTYNAADTIDATLRSALSQSYPELEVVVIDGGSTDETLAIVERHRSRIAHVSSGRDRGIYDAMNKGVAAARGEWIIFLNSGDTFAGPDVLRRIFQDGAIPDADVLYGSTLLTSTETVLRPPAAVGRSYFYFETLCHQSVLARKSAFERFGPFLLDYRILADREWLLRVVDGGGRFARVPEVISVWDPEGFSASNVALSRSETAAFKARHYTRLEQALLPWRMRLLNLTRKLGWSHE